jgi:phosphatidylserine/phosphatidylglycerophosphate/cardiolipin synthase-like enzyme
VLVDGEITVLGSGNMDRASWFTSQELGVALFGREVAQSIRVAVDEGLEGRVAYVN